LHLPTNGDASDTEDSLSVHSDDSPDTVQVEIKGDATPEYISQEANQSKVGVALKSGRSNLSAARKRQKPPNKLSWRERLEVKRNDADEEEASESDSDTSLSDDKDYSEWSGFGSEDDNANSVAQEGTIHQGSSDSDDEIPPQNADEVELDNFSATVLDGDDTVHERASQFKSWAREQSGFGISQSNISSLPSLPSSKPDSKAKPKTVTAPENLPRRSKPTQVATIPRAILTTGGLRAS